MTIDALCNAELACLEALYQCLLRERDCLVLYRTEDLLENNARKEFLISELTDVREERRGIISDEDLKGDPVYVAWSEKNGRLFDLCSSNHGFIERSLGRQAQLLDNLRKLMGGPAIYSKQGEFAHTPSSGRVVAGRY